MFYGYGIVDKHGDAFFDDGCVYEYRDRLDDKAAELNQVPDERTPYRVVRLQFFTE